MAAKSSDPQYLAYLKESLLDLFSSDELKEVCFSLGIDYESFETNTKPNFARELILYAKRRRLLNKLIAACKKERPNHDWDNRPEEDTPIDIAVTAASGRLRSQAEHDATALDLTRRQLDFSGDAPQVAQSELDAAFKKASTAVRVTIFQLAQEARRSNWFDFRTKWRMERTIPIFRALIASDVEERYHRNHANLAYALKDRRKPDWPQARAELTKAIEMRGPAKDYGYAIYEFNRAICEIMIEGAASQGKRSSRSARKAILDDLRTAAAGGLKSLIKDNEVVREWLRINRVALTSL